MPTFEQEIYKLIEANRYYLQSRPLNLGGVSSTYGGAGGPPGGFIGYLPQKRVAFDESEEAIFVLPTSGLSLLDNLNRIRYRLTILEASGTGGSGSGVIIVDENTSDTYAVGTIHLEGDGFTTASTPPSGVTITIPGRHYVTQGGTAMTQRPNLTFQGSVTVTDDSGSNATIVDITSGGATNLSDLLDVYIDGYQQDGDILTWDAGNSLWTYETLTLGIIYDVDLTSIANGDTIVWNSVSSTWVNTPRSMFGDDYGYSVFESDGTLYMSGDATVWDDLRVPGYATRVGDTAPSFSAFGPSGNLRTLRFEASHDDEVFFELQMPHSWKEGSNIYPHIHWTPVSATTGNVVFSLEYSWQNVGGTFGAPSTMNTNATAAGGTAWVHKLTRFYDGSANDYISGSGKTISSMLVCRLHRNAGSGSDTLAADVAFLEIDFHYEMDTLGSRGETSK